MKSLSQRFSLQVSVFVQQLLLQNTKSMRQIFQQNNRKRTKLFYYLINDAQLVDVKR